MAHVTKLATADGKLVMGKFPIPRAPIVGEKITIDGTEYVVTNDPPTTVFDTGPLGLMSECTFTVAVADKGESKSAPASEEGEGSKEPKGDGPKQVVQRSGRGR